MNFVRAMADHECSDRIRDSEIRQHLNKYDIGEKYKTKNSVGMNTKQ
jgi:hypothetical protein